ncbi:lipopolysaccharide biosynthesis protein [Peterkaempfera bronchialis]|uniref:lipopolysaccharide biosynthesis protein n=1 Tax=Peterkaempfera bronchialis TaxID=2126346 RepID=UPI003C2CE998
MTTAPRRPRRPRRPIHPAVRRWWPLLLGVPLGAAAGGGYAMAAGPAYTAHAYLVAVPQENADSGAAVGFAQAYGRLVTQPQVLHLAAAAAGTSAEALADRVSGTTSPDAPMIEVSGTAATPQRAAGAADAVARALVTLADASTEATRMKLVTLASAVAPDRPATPVPGLDIAVGAASGLLLGGLLMATRQGTTAQADAAAAAALPLPEQPTEPTEPTQPATPARSRA